MSPKLKKVLVIILCTLFVVGFIVFMNSRTKTNEKQKDTSLTQNSYTDPYSGETVDYPGGKGPDEYGNSAAGTVFLGSSRLLDEGISLEQLKSYEYAAYQYFKTLSPKVTEISLDKSTIKFKLHDPNSANQRDNISFTIVTNRTTKYNASLDTFDTSSIQLKIFSQENNSQVYDSGVVTNKYL